MRFPVSREISASVELSETVCRKTCVSDCLGDASLHLDITIRGVGGPSVPWVSMPGPTGVLPMPKQDGIGSRAPTHVVALCRWW